MLMPPLIDKWNVLKDEDKDLFPLLEVRFSNLRLGRVFLTTSSQLTAAVLCNIINDY